MDDPILTRCDADTLRAIANFLEGQAQVYRARADLLDGQHRERDEASTLIKRAFSTPDLVEAHMTAGMTLHAAVHAAAAESGFPTTTIEWHWRRRQREQQIQTRAAKHQQVIQLARDGLDNTTIAERVGLHPVSVSRIISQQIRRRRPESPEAR